jgi:hypothetical protein
MRRRLVTPERADTVRHCRLGQDEHSRIGHCRGAVALSQRAKGGSRVAATAWQSLELSDPENVAVRIAEESAFDPARKSDHAVDDDPAASELLDLLLDVFSTSHAAAVRSSGSVGRSNRAKPVPPPHP